MITFNRGCSEMGILANYLIMNTKKLTIKYWNSLSKDSKKRALSYVFPVNDSLVEMLANEDPRPKDSPWWKIVFSKVKEVLPDSYGSRPYKTCVNRVYLA